MKRKLLPFLFAMLCMVTQTMAMTGSGTTADPFQISSATDLITFRDNYVNNGTNVSACAKLTQDITLTDEWTPIGTSIHKFSGTFDGANFTISGLSIKASPSNYEALFYSNDGIIKNLNVDANIVGKSYCAIITCDNNGTISHCTSKGSVFSQGNSGGIAAINRKAIEYCTNEAEMKSSGGIDNIGGITNENQGTISCCCNLKIIQVGGKQIGGIAGSNTAATATISNCYDNAEIYGSLNVGGIVGSLEKGAVSNCYGEAYMRYTGTSDTDIKSIGLIVGHNDNGTVTNCHYNKDYSILNTGGWYVGLGNNEANTYANTSRAFSNGSVARLLNGGDGTTQSATGAWGQLLKLNDYPVFMETDKSNAVYEVSVNDTLIYYENKGTLIMLPTHSPKFSDEKILTGNYTDGTNIYTSSYTTEEADTKLSDALEDMAKNKDATDGFYKISTPLQMKWFEYYVNESTDHAATNARLTADIDLSSVCSATAGNWTPIANEKAKYSYGSSGYRGTFDGNNKTISGFYINAPKDYYLAMFMYVGSSAVIKNLTLIEDINNNGFCGGIALYHSGTISHCTTKGTVTTGGFWGGMAYSNVGTIEYCTNEAKTTATTSIELGGLVSSNSGQINHCVNKGAIECSDYTGNYTGGIAGTNERGTITDCCNLGAITSTGYVGGIAGINKSSSSVSNCYNTADVKSTSSAKYISDKYPSTSGAILGYNENMTTNCHYLSTMKLVRSNMDTTLVGIGNGTSEANTYVHTAEVFKSGKTARLLNGGDGTTEKPLGEWGQNLTAAGGDDYPVMMTENNVNAVYCVTAGNDKYYGNTDSVINLTAPFSFDGTIIGNIFTDGTNIIHNYKLAKRDVTLTAITDDMESHKNADGYYEISTPVQMKWLSYYVNASTDHAATNARLMNDIDLSYVCSETAGNWTPIGNYGANSNLLYNGTLDGNGKMVSNLYIANATTDYQGLFGYNQKNSVVRNLTVSGNISSAKSTAGLLTGANDGQIKNCTSSGSVTGDSKVGGITGMNGGDITQCDNKAALSDNQGIIGGITAGLTGGNVTDCMNEGNVKTESSTSAQIGGIVGYSLSTIKNCLNVGKVYIAESKQTGAYPILGTNQNSQSTLTNNYYLNSLNGSAAFGAAKTADELKTGYVARLLNGGDGTTEKPLGTWGQDLKAGNAYPVFMTANNANAVYCVTIDDSKNYGNDKWVIMIQKATTSFVGEKIFIGDYKDEAGNVVSGSYTIMGADAIVSQTVDNMADHKSTKDGYYEISTPVQMKWFATYVNDTNYGINARLMDDIDLSSICSATAGNWKPITQNGSSEAHFGGTFDGNGKTIYNLYIANDTTANVGLFGATSRCTIKNLHVSGNITSKNSYVGLLVGINNGGKIDNCTVSGSATGISHVGGITGENIFGNITRCVNKAELNDSCNDIGGIIGVCHNSMFTIITDCLNEGTIKTKTSDNAFIGGIIGRNIYSYKLKNCLNVGKIYMADVLTEAHPILGTNQEAQSSSTNNYYLNTLKGTATYGIAKTAEELKTGAVARLLNGGNGTTEKPLSTWGQNLDSISGNAHPVLMTDGNANAVYCVTAKNKYYGNTGCTVRIGKTATFNDTKINTLITDGTKFITSYKIDSADVTLNSDGSDDMTNHLVNGYYEISTPVQMEWFSYYVNESSAHVATNARLMDDIDLSTICNAKDGNWTPIGNYGANSSLLYNGTFDGNGKTISNLYIANATTDNQGLFGYNQSYSVVRNLTVSGNISSSKSTAGLLTGTNDGQIKNCTSSGSVTGDSKVGGITGMNGGDITQCVNKATLNDNKGIIGGITAGLTEGNVTNCMNEGTVKTKSSTSAQTGGIAGYCMGTIENCLNVGKVYMAEALTEAYPILGTDQDSQSTINNDYYLNTLNGTAAFGTAKTADELKAGYVARLLNGGDGTTEKPLGTWGQKLTTADGNAYPVFMTANNANAVYSAKVYKGSSTATEGCINLSYAKHGDNTMTVLKDANVSKKILPINVITAKNIARRIIITDRKDFYIPADVTADSVSYSRSAYRDGYHETLCIPFVPAALPADYEFSAYTQKNNTTAYFNTVAELTAGQAYTMKYTAEANDTRADVTFENNGGNVKVTALPVSSDFIGSYVTVSSPDATSYILGVYDVDGTKTEIFRRATTTYKPVPFRAYLNVTANAKDMQIVFDGETTGIGSAATPNPSLLTPNSSSAYFNLQGIKVNAPQQNGIYIHNGKKVVFRTNNQ